MDLKPEQMADAVRKEDRREAALNRCLHAAGHDLLVDQDLGDQAMRQCMDVRVVDARADAGA